MDASSRRVAGKVDMASERVSITREAIVAAALKIADEEGIDAVSMRRVARSVGVEAMSLYHYVSSKDDLLDSVADAVYAEMRLPNLSDRWQDNVRNYAIEFRGTLLLHPNVVALVAARPVMGTGAIAVIEIALAELRRIGFEAEHARKMLNILVSFVLGHTLTEVGALPSLAGHSLDEIQQFRQGLPETAFPNVAATLGTRWPDRDAEFSVGIDMLIVGMESALVQ